MLDLLKDWCNCFLLLKFTRIFHFLLKKVLETYQVYYTILFIAFEFIVILNRFFVALKSLNNLLLQKVSLQVSSKQISSVNKLYYVGF